MAYYSLTVAYHPYLAAQTAEDDTRGGETVFGMVGEMGKQVFDVAGAYGGGGQRAELVAGNVALHLADDGRDGEHGQLAVAVAKTGECKSPPTVAMAAAGALRGGTVDDGDEVRGDDDSVLASPFRVFGDEGLFLDGHGEDGESGFDGFDGFGGFDGLNGFDGRPGRHCPH